MTVLSDPTDPAVAVYLAAILSAVTQQRMGLEEATLFVKGLFGNPELADAAHAVLRERQRGIRAVKAAVVNPESYTGDGWYLGAIEGGHWAKYRDLLIDNGVEDLGRLHDETETIVSLLAAPNIPGQKRKGLVMGNVQSGKTRNFAGVIAKAADAGYRFVIVLSGINNNLREQTQARLSQQLFYVESWYPLTGTNKDFAGVQRPQALLVNQPMLCAVVKKNSTRLRRLVQMMRSVPQEIRRIRPVLIIDDEADQATPNSLAQQARVSAINQRLRDLWNTVISGTYLAYTATPFANVFMNPDDNDELFPSDFITTIEPGAGYFGAERVFGVADTVDGDGATFTDGLDMVRKIPSEEAETLRPPSNSHDRLSFDVELPPSLMDAFAWFVVATAIRRARGRMDHSSMLVHTTHYTQPHFAMQRRLLDLVKSAQQQVTAKDLGLFHKAWCAESTRVAEEATMPLPTWTNVAEQLPTVLSGLEVIVDNGSSSDRLNYDGDQPRTVVAVGGGTLSRGLTLEGLVVSYFTRTSNAYDTLMQMGRWFGYRPGYEDLPRVWVTDGLDEDYAFLARVERDLRDEIHAVEGSEFSPKQVGVKVRAHPGRLQVTSANRMFHADVVQLGLSGTFNQTFILDGSDLSIAQKNYLAAEELIRGHDAVHSPTRITRPMFTGVTGERISTFLDQFQAHPDQAWLSNSDNRERMKEWVVRWASGPVWNVVLMGSQGANMSDGVGGLGTIKMGQITLGCLDRSALRASTPDKVNFKAIMSQEDRICDINPALYAGESHGTNSERRRIRRLHGKGKGLVVIYPISKNSKAPVDHISKAGGLPRRVDMAEIPVDHHLLGFAIFFPYVNDSDGGQGAFVSVRPMWEIPDTVEGDEFTDEDDATEGDADNG